MEYFTFNIKKSADNLIFAATAWKLITSRILMKKKLNSDRNLLQYNVYLVTRKFKQCLRFEYTERWLMLIDIHYVWLLMCISVAQSFKMLYINLHTALVKSKSKDEIWISLLACLKMCNNKIEVDINTKSGESIRLFQTLYGFKLGSLKWFEQVKNFFSYTRCSGSFFSLSSALLSSTQHFLRSLNSTPEIFSRCSITSLYSVDHLIIDSSHRVLIKLKMEFYTWFKIKNHCYIEYYFRMLVW